MAAVVGVVLIGREPEVLWHPARAKLVTSAPAKASTGFLPIIVVSPILERSHRAGSSDSSWVGLHFM